MCRMFQGLFRFYSSREDLKLVWEYSLSSAACFHYRLMVAIPCVSADTDV